MTMHKVRSVFVPIYIRIKATMQASTDMACRKRVRSISSPFRYLRKQLCQGAKQQAGNQRKRQDLFQDIILLPDDTRGGRAKDQLARRNDTAEGSAGRLCCKNYCGIFAKNVGNPLLELGKQNVR